MYNNIAHVNDFFYWRNLPRGYEFSGPRDTLLVSREKFFQVIYFFTRGVMIHTRAQKKALIENLEKYSLSYTVIKKILQYTNVFGIINWTTYKEACVFLLEIHNEMSGIIGWNVWKKKIGNSELKRICQLQRQFLPHVIYLPNHSYTLWIIYQLGSCADKISGTDIDAFDIKIFSENCHSIINLFEKKKFHDQNIYRLKCSLNKLIQEGLLI
jgi:hypothetical protein